MTLEQPPAGQEIYPRVLDHPLTEELGEASILHRDLVCSIRTIELWRDNFAEKPDQASRMVAESLFRDAVVQFIGCFDRTNRFRLDETEIYGHDQIGVEYFSWLKNIRDSYAAHKYGAQRQYLVGVILDKTTSIEATVEAPFIYQGPPKDAADGMIRMMNYAVATIRERIVDLRSRLLAEAKKLPQEERPAPNET